MHVLFDASVHREHAHLFIDIDVPGAVVIFRAYAQCLVHAMANNGVVCLSWFSGYILSLSFVEWVTPAVFMRTAPTVVCQ